MILSLAAFMVVPKREDGIIILLISLADFVKMQELPICGNVIDSYVLPHYERANKKTLFSVYIFSKRISVKAKQKSALLCIQMANAL